MNNELIFNYNKATDLLNRKKPEKAISIFRKILKAYDCKEAYTNLGNCYRMVGRDKEMFECYKNALLPSVPFLDPNSKTDEHALNNLGLAHFMYGEDDKAIACYRLAIEKNPEFWEAWWNCSTATLRKASTPGGSQFLSSGWEMYRSRFLKADPIVIKNDREGLMYWDTKTPGDTIIVLAEQGIGDSIMWGRYLSLLPFSRVIVQCDDSCRDLFPGYETCFYPSKLSLEGNVVAYPMCGLGEAFDYIPPGDWLKGKFDVEKFDSSKLNVGIVWAGSNTHANDRYRSIPVGYFSNLSKYCNLYSLSPGFKSTRHVMGLPISSWADTAKYINGLDLVIGVDTSVMHLAGSLGAEAWLLQPYKETDFRWGQAYSGPCPATGKSAWYDSVTVFNNPQSWEFVFRNVENEIRKRTMG